MAVNISPIGVLLQALNTDLHTGATIATNSTHNHLSRIAGDIVTKSITLNGAGAQNDNIFIVTGAVEGVFISGECTEATDATTVTTCYWDLYDGTVSYPLTAAGGTNLSGIGVGGMIYKDATVASALTFDNNATGVFNDGGGEGYFTTMCPFRVTKKTGVTTYIRFNFTGDANTDVDMTFTVSYIAKSSDGKITAA